LKVAVPVTNPFATRFTRPGRIEPLDVIGRPVDIDALLDRLRELCGTAAIVGPHGSGKSTLLTHLAAAIERRGERVRRARLHSWRDVPTAWTAIRGAAAGDTVCIDSWECLGVTARSVLRLAARMSGCGLLVTSHRGTGLPELIRCGTSASLLRSIVRSLPGHACWHGHLIHETDIEAAFALHGGNLRESLYELYDRFEACASRIRAGVRAGPDGRDGSDGGRHEIHELGDGFSCVGAPERNLG
jgi:energy-coupling factor transporter ATP-binding protein EcfA2